MKRKLLVILFFIVVFGLPVIWYFILQIFGENKFDLPVLEKIEDRCIVINNQAYLQMDSLAFLGEETQLKRLDKRLKTIEPSNLRVVYSNECRPDNKISLVDEKGQLRGEYLVSREETDRLLTEIDIYLKNLLESRTNE
ncbi:MAG: hypothetical protein JXR03_12495 [Cyclobacteriaceae bacterium]